MIKKIGSCLIVSLSCISLSGCGINASVEPMTYTYTATQKPANHRLLNSIGVAEVSGGHEINPLLGSEISDNSFREALEKSLQNSKLYQQNPSANYLLNAKIMRFERPVIGFDFKATLTVNYKLINTKNNTTVYSKTITSSHTATVKDAFVGVTRLKLANEGAAKENFHLLIEDLYRL